MSTYLNRDELTGLTGYTQRTAIIRWLDANGWPYVLSGIDGWPRVLRMYHDQRLMGVKIAATKRKAAEPDWTRQ